MHVTYCSFVIIAWNLYDICAKFVGKIEPFGGRRQLSFQWCRLTSEIIERAKTQHYQADLGTGSANLLGSRKPMNLMFLAEGAKISDENGSIPRKPAFFAALILSSSVCDGRQPIDTVDIAGL